MGRSYLGIRTRTSSKGRYLRKLFSKIDLRTLTLTLSSETISEDTCLYWMSECEFQLSRLPGKHFGKFTSQISPSYEIKIILKVTYCVHMRRKVFPGSEISLADGRDLGDHAR